jgi:hypothetical protein
LSSPLTNASKTIREKVAAKMAFFHFRESCANLGEKGNSPSEVLELQLSTLENGADAGKIVKIETLLPKIEKEEGSGSVLEPTTTNLDKIKGKFIYFLMIFSELINLDDITKLKYQLQLLENDLEDITQESSPK